MDNFDHMIPVSNPMYDPKKNRIQKYKKKRFFNPNMDKKYLPVKHNRLPVPITLEIIICNGN